MSASQVPNSPQTGGGFGGILVDVILLTPFAALAAGTGAFVGSSIAIIGFGPESLGSGAVVGAGVGVLLVLAWAVLFVSRARGSKEASQVHAEKLASYFQDMQSRGINPDGPVFRLLWMLGLKVPPPLFLGPTGSFLFPFGVFAPMVLTAGAVLWWQRPDSPPWVMWVTASIFLLVVIAASVYNIKATRSMAMKLQLPSWDQYAPGPATATPNRTIRERRRKI
jgi:hypothetical protein